MVLRLRRFKGAICVVGSSCHWSNASRELVLAFGRRDEIFSTFAATPRKRREQRVGSICNYKYAKF